MSTGNDFYDYRYHIDGRKIALLQRNKDVIYDPYVDFDEDIYTTPDTADTNAILIRYTTRGGVPTDETSSLGLSRNLSLAVIEYVKAKLLEENNNIKDQRLAEACMRKFHAKVQREMTNRKGHGRVAFIIPQGPGVIK